MFLTAGNRREKRSNVHDEDRIEKKSGKESREALPSPLLVCAHDYQGDRRQDFVSVIEEHRHEEHQKVLTLLALERKDDASA